MEGNHWGCSQLPQPHRTEPIGKLLEAGSPEELQMHNLGCEAHLLFPRACRLGLGSTCGMLVVD